MAAEERRLGPAAGVATRLQPMVEPKISQTDYLFVLGCEDEVRNMVPEQTRRAPFANHAN